MAHKRSSQSFMASVATTAADVAMGYADQYLRKKLKADDEKERKYPASSQVSTNRAVSATAVSTSVGTFENVVWGLNPFPHLARFSSRYADAKAQALSDGVAINAPITLHDWEFGDIWSAVKSAGVWSSDYQQGQCRWYAFPTIAASDCDKAFAACWSNDNSVDASHVTGIESFINCLEFKNTANGACEVDVFECWPRDDIPIGDPATAIIKADTDILYQGSDTNLLGGPDLFAPGYVDPWQPNPTGSVSLKPLNWDFTPYDHPVWRNLFKISPCYHRFMAPGDTTRAHFGIVASKILDPQDNMMPDGAIAPTQSIWAYKKEYGPIFLMRVRGTLVHAENSSTDVTLGDDSKIAAGEGHANRHVVNYGNFCVNFIWSSKMICRKIGVTGDVLPQEGYYGGLYPVLNTQTFDYGHEQIMAPNNPANVDASS